MELVGILRQRQSLSLASSSRVSMGIMPGMPLVSYGLSQTKVNTPIHCVITTDRVKGKNGARMDPGPTVPRIELLLGTLRMKIWDYFI